MADQPPKSPLQSLLSGALMPQLPAGQNPELINYLRKLTDYIRRLMGQLTATNIIQEIVNGGGDGSGTTVIVDWQYDPVTHKFQIKTQDVVVLGAGAVSGWTNVAVGQPVVLNKVVDDVNYSTATHVLSKDTTVDVYVLDIGAQASATNIDTAVDSCT
jgi:hypothetical protein